MSSDDPRPFPSSQQINCVSCGTVLLARNLTRHLKSCTGLSSFKCLQCNYSSTSKEQLDFHKQLKHSPTPTFDCKVCSEKFTSFYQLQSHANQKHDRNSRANSGIDVDLSSFSEDPVAQLALSDCKHFLVDRFVETKHQTIVNHTLVELDTNLVIAKLDDLFKVLTCAVKISISLGYLLRNVETEEYRYFYADNNYPILPVPHLVSNESDLQILKDTIESTDLLEHVTRERPDTKSKFYKVINMTIFAVHMRDIRLGCRDVQLPRFIIEHPYINVLMRRGRHSFNDNLCVFRGIAVHLLQSEVGLAAKTRELAMQYCRETGKEIATFVGVTKEEFAVVERILQVNIFLYEVTQENRGLIGTLSRRSPNQYEDTINFIYFENHVCYVKDINKLFYSFKCEHCLKHFKRKSWLERHAGNCNGCIKHVYPGCFYNLPTTVFKDLEDLDIIIPQENQLFTNLAVFDFESYCIPDESLIDTEKVTWIGRHVPFCVSIASNFEREPTFICENDPDVLVIKFLEELQRIAEISETEMNEKLGSYLSTLSEKVTDINTRLVSMRSHDSTESILTSNVEEDYPINEVLSDETSTLEDLEDGSIGDYSDDETLSDTTTTWENTLESEETVTEVLSPGGMQPVDDLINLAGQNSVTLVDESSYSRGLAERRDVDVTLSSQNDLLETEKYLKHLKRKLTNLRTRLSKYISQLPVFGFNSGKYDLNLIKSFLIPHLVNNGYKIDTMKKSNNFVSLSFDNIVFLDILNFLGGATNLDSFLKAYQCSETKGFFPYDWVTSYDKMDEKQFPPYESFYNNLRKVNSLEVHHLKYRTLVRTFSQQETFKKMNVSSVPLTGQENYQYLKDLWVSQGMQTFKDFTRWYTNKDVSPTLEAIRKMMDFYHSKRIDMAKVSCTLPGLANRILHESTNESFALFSEKDKDLDELVRSNIVGGASIVFNRYGKKGETFIRNTKNVLETIVGVDASQLYPYAMSHAMPVGMYRRWNLNTETNKFKPQNNPMSLELKVMTYQQSIRPNCQFISYATTGCQATIGPFFPDGLCKHCNTVIEVHGCWYHCHEECQPVKTNPTKAQQDIEKRRKDSSRQTYIENKGFRVVVIWECHFWKDVKANENGLKTFMKENFPYVPNMSELSLINRIRDEKIFGMALCTVRVPDYLKKKFEDFPPIFKNCLVSRSDIGEHMQRVAEDQNLLRKPQRMTISSYWQIQGLFITPLLNFYLEQELEVSDVTQFIEYKPFNCFQTFVQSVVDARRKGDENPNSSVLAETMKLIGNSAYGRQIMNRSKHQEVKYIDESLVDRKVNDKLFRVLTEITDNCFEINQSKKSVKHQEPIVVGFFILQYAKLRMLELVYNFFHKFCDKDLYEFIEMDTDSLYMSLGKKDISDCIRPEMKKEWNRIRSLDCTDTFKANPELNFFPRTCCPIHKKYDKREPGLFKEEWRGDEMIALCSKTYCGINLSTQDVKFSSKGLNKANIEQPAAKYRKVMETKVNEESINRGFRCVNHGMVTYEMRKKGLSYFYPKRKVLDNGIHTIPLDV